MVAPEDAELMREPDALLFTRENSKAINDFLSQFTIPLQFFRGPISVATWNGIGTAVLVELDGHVFALTAGHCVRSYEAAHACVVGVAREPSCYAARFGRRGYVASGDADYGFLEIPPSERASYRAHEHFPMKAGRIHVTSPEELVSANDWMVLSGFPGDVTVASDRGRGTRFFTYSTTIAGLGESPPTGFAPPLEGARVLDLWVPLRRQLQCFPVVESDVEVPLFAGASGGGCWKTGIRPHRTALDLQGMQLVGLHTLSTDPHEIRDEPTRFAREVLVGHHLRLIADLVPALRDTILRRWPVLEDPSWNAQDSLSGGVLGGR